MLVLGTGAYSTSQQENVHLILCGLLTSNAHVQTHQFIIAEYVYWAS